MSTNNNQNEINYEQILFTALVNEGKHIRLLSSKRQTFTYNEKQLREEAANEVAAITQSTIEEPEDGKKKRKSSTEEKSRQKDRNREHAKNTRLRKKAFLQKLQEVCEKLTTQRNKEIEDRLALGKRIYDTQNLRKNAVRLFLQYRASNIQDYSKWATILDESFTMTIPITPYMPFNKTEVINSQRVLNGINSFMADVASLAMMVDTVGFATPAWVEALLTEQGCRIWYEIGDKGDMIPAADIVMCRFFMRTEGHDRVGAPTSLAKHGMLRCKFNKKNKIVSAEMTFDVMSFMQQYQRSALLTTDSAIIPNSIEMAMQPSGEARLVASFQSPHIVNYVNNSWWNLKGFKDSQNYENKSLEEVLKLQNNSLQSYHSQFNTVIFSCIPQVCRGIPTRIHWIYPSPRSNENVLAYLKIIPIANESLEISHFLLILYEIKLPSHISPDPLNILGEPVIQPKPSSIIPRPLTKTNSSNEINGILDTNLNSFTFSSSVRGIDWDIPLNIESFQILPSNYSGNNSNNINNINNNININNSNISPTSTTTTTLKSNINNTSMTIFDHLGTHTLPSVSENQLSIRNIGNYNNNINNNINNTSNIMSINNNNNNNNNNLRNGNGINHFSSSSNYTLTPQEIRERDEIMLLMGSYSNPSDWIPQNLSTTQPNQFVPPYFQHHYTQSNQNLHR